MTAFAFEAIGASAEPNPATPFVRLRLRVRCDGRPVDAMALLARVQIEPWRREYEQIERSLLSDLSFVNPLQWTQTSAMVGRFEREAEFDVILPCTYDLQVAAGKYGAGLHRGDIPLRLFFNGTVFRGAESGFQVEMLSWDSECTARLPVDVWRQAMDACFRGQAWIRVGRETLDAFRAFQSARNLHDDDGALSRLLSAAAPIAEGSS